MAGTHADQDPGYATSLDPEAKGPEDFSWVPRPRPRPKRRGRRVLWALVVVVVLAVGTGFVWTQRQHLHLHLRLRLGAHAAAAPGVAGGLSWSRVAGTDVALLPTGIVVGGPGFVAGSSAAGQPFWTSADGANWSPVPVTDQRLGSFQPQAMASWTGRIYAAGRQGQGQGGGSDPQARFGVWSSADGQTWSAGVTPAATLQPGAGLAAGSHRGLFVSAVTGGSKGLVAVGYLADANRSQPLAWYSADGRSWHAATLPPDRSKSRFGRRLDGVITIPGGFLAIEGAVPTTDLLHTGAQITDAQQEGPLGMYFSTDGQSWRVVANPPVPLPGPGQSLRGVTVGLLKFDRAGVLAVGVDAEAREVFERSHGEARRVVVDRPRPVVWRLERGTGWVRVSQALPQTIGEVGPALPAQASVRAVADVGGRLLAVGDVTHGDAGDPSDSAVWTSTDGGRTWSDAVSGAQFTGAGSGSLSALVLGADGATVVAIGADADGTPELWRAVPVGTG